VLLNKCILTLVDNPYFAILLGGKTGLEDNVEVLKSLLDFLLNGSIRCKVDTHFVGERKSTLVGCPVDVLSSIASTTPSAMYLSTCQQLLITLLWALSSWMTP
jgi:hypothetical protein